MAEAVSNIKRVRVEGNITLTLTPEEAIFLRAFLGSTIGGNSTAEKYSRTIWCALKECGVPSINVNIFENIAANTSIRFAYGSDLIVEDAVVGYGQA